MPPRASTIRMAAALALLTPLAADRAEAARPNVVLILADDLGADCLNSYGGTSSRTPTLAARARSGVRFTRAFCPPLCSPSRVELMTGRYGFRTGWTRLIESVDDYLDPARE